MKVEFIFKSDYMRRIMLFVGLFLVSGVAMGQYDFAIGIRSGGTSGLTLKKNYETHAVEGIIGFWNDGASITCLWERNVMALNEPGLNWIYGLGGHVAFYGDDFNNGPSWYNHPRNPNDGNFGLGIDGTVGLEYKIPGAPIAIDIGLKPYIELIADGGFFFLIDPGVGIKVAF
jgi:hypothetical protein